MRGEEKALKQGACEKVNHCQACLSYADSVTTLMYPVWLFSRSLYSITRKKYGENVSWKRCDQLGKSSIHIHESVLVCKVHSQTTKFSVSFKFTLFLWYFQLSLRKGYGLTWHFDILNKYHFKKALSEKNRKNATQKKKKIQLLIEGLCCRHRSDKNTFLLSWKQVFQRQNLPQQLFHSFTFWQISGILLSLQTRPLSLSLVTSFSYKYSCTMSKP